MLVFALNRQLAHLGRRHQEATNLGLLLGRPLMTAHVMVNLLFESGVELGSALDR